VVDRLAMELRHRGKLIMESRALLGFMSLLLALLVCPEGYSGWPLLRGQPDQPAIRGSGGRIAGSRAVAVLLIGAHSGLRHHSATAKQ
jgi:hypothetical protein